MLRSVHSLHGHEGGATRFMRGSLIVRWMSLISGASGALHTANPQGRGDNTSKGRANDSLAHRVSHFGLSTQTEQHTCFHT